MYFRAIFFALCSALFLLTSPVLGMSRAAAPQQAVSSLYLGVRTLHLQDSSRNRPVVVELWYPTDAAAIPLDSLHNSIWIHPDERRNAPLAESHKKYPLIVTSHGHRGDRREATWLASSLVQEGYIVAAVEHHGDTFHHLDPQISVCFWERSKDIGFALDQLLAIDWLQNRINTEQIGFVGYSLGGMTGLHIAGAVAQNLEHVYKARWDELASRIGKASIDKIDFSEGEKSYIDPRIRAMVLICPATFAFSSEAMKKVEIPIGLVATVDDEVLDHRQHAFRLIQNKVPAKLKLLRDRKISHYAFLNRVKEQAKAHVPAPLAVDPASYNRADVHAEVAEFSRQFFKEKLDHP